MTNRRSSRCSCFSCFSGRNTPSPPSAQTDAAPVDPANASSSAPPPSGGSSSIPSAPPPPSGGASSSSTVPQTEGDNVEVNLDALIERISQRLELIKESKKPPQTKGAQQDWSTSSKTFFKLKEMLSEGINVVKDVIPGDTIKTAVKGVLQGMGTAHLVTAGLLVVANILERFEEVKANKDECLRLLSDMVFLAKVVKQFKERRELLNEGMHDIIKSATELIVEGTTMCCYQIDSSKYSKFFRAPVNKEHLDNFRQDIDCIYRHINTQMGICILDATARKRAPLSRIYPDDAVGIEESVKEIIDLLEWGSDKKAIAVMLHGFGGIGKTTLAQAAFSVLHIPECKYSTVRLFQNIDSSPDIIKLQRKILEDLMAPETVPEIRDHEQGQRQLALILEKVTAFIYIDNVVRQDELGQLLPKNMNKANKVRLLLTARDQDVRTAVKVKTYVYRMRGLPDTEATKLLGREIHDDETEDKEEQISDIQLKEIVQSYGGIPKLLELVGGFIRGQEDKQEAYRILMEEKEKWDSEVGKIESYLFAYNHLPEMSKDPFLDICSFFKGWDWDTVEHIVGELELKMLESRALVTKGTDGVVAVHDVILSVGLRKTEGVRFTFTSGNQLKELLNEKEIPEIKGIWLSENNKDLLDIPASKLDSMCSSLRVLTLGNLIKVQDTCNETFKKLVFLQAAVPHLPFDVSQSKGLKYLKYEPRDLNFHEIPSSVTCMEFDGRLHSNAFEISSGDFQHLGKLRILRLTHFVALKKLPEELGDLLNGLRELTLSYCSSVEELPGSISTLQYLRVIRMEYCSSLRQLPEDFGSLISLQKLNLQGCKNLKVLPGNFEKLTALKLLDLSYCERLVDLPPGLGNLTSLAELDLKGCRQLTSIPEGIGQLKSLASSVDMSGCSSLKELPNGFCNLSFITKLSLKHCSNLEKLPDRFGELVNLCKLDLSVCKNLEDLCNNFHCLDSLEILDLSGCHSLKALPECFQCLASLRILYLVDCLLLEGKEMDKVVKIRTLQWVSICESEMLMKRWGEIQREDNALWSFIVFTGRANITGQDLSTVEKELLSKIDSLLSNGEGEPFHLSHHLSADSLFLLIFDADNKDFPWPLFEETIDEIQTKFEIIYMGNQFNELPLKVKGKIVGHGKWNIRSADVLMKVLSILDVADGERRADPDPDPDQDLDLLMEVLSILDVADPDPDQDPDQDQVPNRYFEMRTKMAGDEKGAKDYRPCWKMLTSREVEEFVLSNCRSYQRLKQLEARSGDQSNIELLRELFPTGKGETTHIFRKINYASQKASIETCGVEELKGKRILLDIRPLDMCYDFRMGSLILYNTMKEAFNLEVISIPLVQPNTNINLEMLEQFSGDAPWLVLQNPCMLRRVVKYFLIKECLPDQGFDLWGEEFRIMYKSIITIIEADGKVFTADKPVLPLLDTWGPKAYPFTGERIKELEEEEWSQMETTSTLELLLNNQESLWHKVKEVLLQQKMICLFGGDGSKKGISMKEFTFFLRNVLIELVDNIHIIYITGFDFKEAKKSNLTDTTHVCYSLPNLHMPKAEMEDMPLLNLLEHEAIRFWTHFYSLREIVSKRDDNYKLKRIFDYIGYHIPWMILIDEDGEIITENGQDMVSLYTKSMEEKAKRLTQILIKGSKKDRKQALFELAQR